MSASIPPTNLAEVLLADGKQLLARGEALLAQQRLKEAVRAAERDLVSGMLLVSVLWWCARALGVDRYEPCAELDEAVRLEERAITEAESTEGYPQELLANLIADHGRSLLRSEKMTIAAEVLERAVSLLEACGRSTWPVRVELARLLIDLDRPKEAAAHMKRILTAEDQEGRASMSTLFILADALRRFDRYEALSTMNRILGSGAAPESGKMKTTVRRWIAEIEG